MTEVTKSLIGCEIPLGSGLYFSDNSLHRSLNCFALEMPASVAIYNELSASLFHWLK